MEAMPRPCAECPWRLDAPVGQFPPERFADLARSAEDMVDPDDPALANCRDDTRMI